LKVVKFIALYAIGKHKIKSFRSHHISLFLAGSVNQF
jgi:hypothetical protein